MKQTMVEKLQMLTEAIEKDKIVEYNSNSEGHIPKKAIEMTEEVHKALQAAGIEY